jgi:hypothetical protein
MDRQHAKEIIHSFLLDYENVEGFCPAKSMELYNIAEDYLDRNWDSLSMMLDDE